MKIKEIFNNLPHKKVYIGIGVIVFLLLITFIVNKTHAFYNNESDTIPIVNAKVGDFKPKLTKVIINNETNQPEYTNNKQVNVYLTWSNDDITEYCLSEINSCTSYTALNTADTQNKKSTIIYNFSGEGTKTIYARIKDKYNRESDISFSTSIIVDTTAPTASVETSNIAETSVTVKITASDTNGISQYCLTPTPQEVQCNKTGTFTISNLQAGTAYNWSYYVEDNAGNTSVSQTISFTTKSKSAADIVFANTTGQIETDEQRKNARPNDTLRRFQNTNPTRVTNNYICFGTTDKNQCTSNQETYMYRIIGVVAQDDLTTGEKVGMLKVIKKEALNARHVWHDDGTSYAAGATWATSTLSRDLNSTLFLNTITGNVGSKPWTDIITTINWRYGDEDTSEHGSGIATLAKEKTWPSTIPEKVGLMYFSDYFLAYDNTSSYSSLYGTTSWLHTANNGGAVDAEWTMMRHTYIFAYYINGEGKIALENFRYSYSVRPVFYLSEKIQIKAGTTGAIDNPYIIEGVSE